MYTDPVEERIANILSSLCIEFKRNVVAPNGRNLDFHVLKPDVWIECKQFFSDRTNEQIAGLDNIILIQGIKAAEAFVDMLLGRF